MLINLLKMAYVLTASILASMIVYGKLFVFKKREPQFVSDYAATMAGLLGVYSLLSIAFVWIFPTAHQKCIMLFFAISPFLIGLFATYHTEKYYTVLQFFLFILSIAYVIF